MNPEQFQALAQSGYTRIPVTLELLADLDTPLSTYLKLAEGPYTFLLESVQGGERWGRYSIIGIHAKSRLVVSGKQVTYVSDDKAQWTKTVDDPLEEVAEFYNSFNVPLIPELHRFQGGLVGYFGYDIVEYIEPKLQGAGLEDPLGLPDILLLVTDQMAVVDSLSGKIHLVVFADPQNPNAYSEAQRSLVLMRAKLRQAYQGPIGQPVLQSRQIQEQDFISEFDRDHFLKSVDTIKSYIVAGDCMQTVLSQRWSTAFYGEPLNLYRALRTLNPSPYMYYFDFGDFHVVGSSPEILARVEDHEVYIRPIAGTRPRGATDEKDLSLEKELKTDPKECAEHLMLIDLGRNDVGKVATPGTVSVTDKMFVERYSHVMHMVSDITGDLKPTASLIDVIRAIHPAGTLSGAPKLRAMEIIQSLEPSKRSLYGGAVGYLGFNGHMDLAIAIRTAVIKHQKLYIQAGAGVVADSNAEGEWLETLNKARGVMKAVVLAEKGLDN